MWILIAGALVLVGVMAVAWLSGKPARSYVDDDGMTPGSHANLATEMQRRGGGDGGFGI